MKNENKTFFENVVIITGASVGIGKELALQLAQQGAWLALAARNFEQLQQVAEQCQQAGGRAIAIATDVADKSQCKRLVEQTIDEYGRIDTLINNAGITMSSRFKDIKDLSIFDKIMQVNYLGSVYTTYYALPYLRQTKGRIVGISSLTGKNGVPTRTGYAASKHAMAGFFDSLRIELEDDGISVTMIYPGFVATEIRYRALSSDGIPLGKSHLNEENIMSAEKCARLIIDAAAKRKREVVMTAKGKLGLWMKLIAPRLVDKVAKKAIEQ